MKYEVKVCEHRNENVLDNNRYISGMAMGDIIIDYLRSNGYKKYGDNYYNIYNYVSSHVSHKGSNGKEGRAKRFFYPTKEVVKLIETYISENKNNLIKEEK